MFFQTALYISLALCGLGLIYKMVSWFAKNVGIVDESQNLSFGKRLGSALGGVLATIFSVRIFKLIGLFVVDVLFQGRILKDKDDKIAWLMHILIFFGFMGCLLFHALGVFVSSAIDPSYQSTLNPWMFMRNLFGLMAMIGLVMAIVRRAVIQKGELKTTGQDIYAIGIVLTIMVTGFLLEATKITSHGEFSSMVEEYGDSSDTESVTALEAYWVRHYGLVSPTVKEPIESALLASGAEQNEMMCQDCHSKPSAAFVSFAIAKMTKPVALQLDRAGVHRGIWLVHILACFLGLAFLAFTKMFHILSTPLSILVVGAAKKDPSPAAIATRQVIELQGCNHGGTCHEECPVRQKRQERISQDTQFNPVFNYLGTKTNNDLGTREPTAQ